MLQVQIYFGSVREHCCIGLEVVVARAGIRGIVVCRINLAMQSDHLGAEMELLVAQSDFRPAGKELRIHVIIIVFPG